jgi:hypothetical protein
LGLSLERIRQEVLRLLGRGLGNEQLGMARDHQHNPDPNTNVARIVRESTDLEAAWAEWSSHVQKDDQRGLALLRTAFEAGWEAAKQS